MRHLPIANRLGIIRSNFTKIVSRLVEKGLLAEAGRLELPGRPIAYKTTDNFLRAFRLSSLKDLPPLPEQTEQITIDEILENAPQQGEENE